MKNKKNLLLSLTSLLGSSILMAQTGQWKLAGNNLNGTQKLGSTNNFSLDFITNNVKRMSLTNAGNVGIGTTAPLSRLHVQTGGSGITPFFQSIITVENSSNSYINLLAPKANETGILFGTSENNVSGGIIYNSGFLGSAPKALQFRTNGNFPRMVLTAEGNVGIGTTTPKSNLHIFRGSAGVAPNVESPIVAEANGNSFINLLTPVANVSGILFGNNNNAADGGIVYGGNFQRMELRTNGNITRMTITDDGEVGIGTTTPEARLHIEEGTLLINTPSAQAKWRFLVDANGLRLFGNSNAHGTVNGLFSAIDGSYSTVSDKRLKTNIQPMPPMLGKISQLKPSLYQFKNSASKENNYGFIAQDVMEIFPSLVSHVQDKERKEDVYLMNYSGFGVIAIKGIQELQKIIGEQQQKINEQQQINQTLEERITKLESALSSSGNNKSIQNSSAISAASLEQNQPNPFNQTTTIRYSLPKGVAGQINLYNANGSLLKTIRANETGQATINGSDLTPGAYTYTLLVNGKTSASKKLVVAK